MALAVGKFMALGPWGSMSINNTYIGPPIPINSTYIGLFGALGGVRGFSFVRGFRVLQLRLVCVGLGFWMQALRASSLVLRTEWLRAAKA